MSERLSDNIIHANPRSSKIGRRPEIFRGSQQNRVSNSEEPQRVVELGLYLGLQSGEWGGIHHSTLISAFL